MWWIIIAVAAYYFGRQQEQNAVTMAAAQRYRDQHPIDSSTFGGTPDVGHAMAAALKKLPSFMKAGSGNAPAVVADPANPTFSPAPPYPTIIA